jgi:hypothetical protein
MTKEEFDRECEKIGIDDLTPETINDWQMMALEELKVLVKQKARQENIFDKFFKDAVVVSYEVILPKG